MIITSDNCRINEVPYRDEKEFQTVLYDHPELLDEEDAGLISVMREVQTDAGLIDVLMVTKDGTIVIVETKLERNKQSRREVVAQIIDYISSVSSLSFYELDGKTKNSLRARIDELDSDFDLPKIVDDKLRTGSVRLVIAVDKANSDLQRIVGFLADHTDFDLWLVEVSKHKENNRYLYSPTTLVKTMSAKSNERISGEITDEQKLFIEDIVSRWNVEYPAMPTNGRGFVYRQVKVKGWPGNLHYEFLYGNANAYLIRLDNEMGTGGNVTASVTDAMRQFEGSDVYGYKIVFRLRNKETNTSQLILTIPKTEKLRSCEIMNGLIDLTRETITKALIQTN